MSIYSSAAGQTVLVPDHANIQTCLPLPHHKNAVAFPRRMPVLFSSFGTFGRIIGVLFFFSLTCAGISSNMAFLETCVRSMEDVGSRYRPVLGRQLHTALEKGTMLDLTAATFAPKELK